MRKIRFPKISLTITDEDGEVVTQTTQDLLMRTLNTFYGPQGHTIGPTMDDLEARLPLRKKISEASGSVLLEDTEWQLLNDAIKPYRWPWTHDDVLKVCHAVTEAEEIEVKENRAQRREKKRG